MADDILHGLKIAILVTDGFEEVELSDGYAPHGRRIVRSAGEGPANRLLLTWLR